MNKEICKKCCRNELIKIHECFVNDFWDEDDDAFWKRGLIYCPGSGKHKFKDALRSCPYSVEHVLTK